MSTTSTPTVLGRAATSPARTSTPARLDAPVVASSGPDGHQDRLRRATRWPFWACVALACAMFVADYLPALPLSLLQRQLPLTQVAWIAIDGPCVTLMALLWCRLATRWQLRDRLRAIGWVWTRYSAPLLVLGIVAAAVTMVAAQALVLALGMSHRTPTLEVVRYAHPGQAVLPLLAVVSSGFLVQALPEELVWRGWLMNCLAHRPRLALAVSATVFACLHLSSNGTQQGMVEHVLYCLGVFGFAFLAGALALRCGSLWVAVGVHGGLHLMADVLPQTALRCDGPSVWVVQGAVMVAVGLLVLRGWRGERVSYTR